LTGSVSRHSRYEVAGPKKKIMFAGTLGDAEQCDVEAVLAM